MRTIEEMTKDAEEDYEKRKIKFPITVTGIENKAPCYREGSITGRKTGDWVAVRPCSDQYEGKTYLGVLLGELPVGIGGSLDKETGVLTLSPHLNPAMYVPDLKKIIWGCGSWWKKIESPEDLSGISDADIGNVWYMKALKELEESC